jgi:hypothetical protein
LTRPPRSRSSVVVRTLAVSGKLYLMPGERTQERIDSESTPESAESRRKLDDPAGSQPRVRGDIDAAAQHRREIGGPKGPEPTRFGDWERAGRCVDF